MNYSQNSQSCFFRLIPFDCLVSVVHFFNRRAIVKIGPEANEIEAALRFNPVIKNATKNPRFLRDMHVKYFHDANEWMVSTNEPENMASERLFDKPLPLVSPPNFITGFGNITICMGSEGVEV